MLKSQLPTECRLIEFDNVAGLPELFNRSPFGVQAMKGYGRIL